MYSPLMEGHNWYREARDYCQSLADEFNLPLANVVGALAALSPGTSWDRNKLETRWLLAILAGHKVAKFKFTTYGANVLKAERIAKGETGLFNPKTGPKTYYFFLCIMDPENNQHVCIDRHAYRIATGLEYKYLTPKQYNAIAEHYRKHARKLGIKPMELQAVLWVDYRKKLEKINDVPF